MKKNSPITLKTAAKALSTLALASILAFGAFGLCSCGSSNAANNNTRNSSTVIVSNTSSASTSSNTSTNSNASTVKNWNDAKALAIGTWMKVHQVNLDNPNLKYMDQSTDSHGYVVRCYIDHGTHIETIFIYSVSKDGKVYDNQLGKYVN